MNSRLFITSIIISVGLFYSCASDSEDGLKADCSRSEFQITISSQTEATCTTGGSVTLSPQDNEGAVTYSLDGTTFDLSSSISDLNAGSYTISGKDELGCIASVNVTIAASTETVLASATVQNTSCGNSEGQITIDASGGSGSFEYSLNGGDFVTNATFTNLPAGDHTVDVRDGTCETSVETRILTGVSLTDEIMPIINANCAISGCHANVQTPRFDSKDAVIAAASRIKARTQARTMPPASRPDLTDDEIELIACWVDDGALNN